jgi:hypothetical protein
MQFHVTFSLSGPSTVTSTLFSDFVFILLVCETKFHTHTKHEVKFN